MKKLTAKQKGSLGFVAAIVSAGLYFFAMSMGWVHNWLADEPEAEKTQVVEQQEKK